MEKITTLRSDYYYYYLNSLSSSSSEGEGLASGSKAYTTLYNGSEQYYWFGSLFIDTNIDCATFGVRSVSYGYVNGNALYDMNTNASGHSGVRPAVILKSDIQLTGSSTDGWEIVKN